MPCQMAGSKVTEAMLLLPVEAALTPRLSRSKKTEAMLLLLAQAEVTMHGDHSAMSDGGLEEDRGNAAAP